VVRGQYEGYREEKGVAPGSRTETFAAMELSVNSWRWDGVPFYVRAGKALAESRTEVIVRLRRPPPITGHTFTPNHVRFRLGPEFVIALGASVREPPDGGHALELLAAHDHAGADTDPFAALLGDALRGETYRFARQDYVEEAWRIVDPVLAHEPEPVPYPQGSWGPPAARELVPGGWVEPPPSSGTGNFQKGGGI
jgi:glucose-6-phosphate 1-dehydrogenase